MPFKQNDIEWNRTETKPAKVKVDSGWTAEEKPPASIFNWFFNRTASAIKDLIDNAIHKEEKAKPNGVATLDANGHVPSAQLFNNLEDIHERMDSIIEWAESIKEYQIYGAIVSPFNVPITEFPKNKLTIQTVGVGQLTEIPGNYSGNLETYRAADDKDSYQVFKTNLVNQIHRRTWNTVTGKWGEFERIDAARLKNRVTKNVSLTIPANGIVDVDVTDIGAISVNDNVVATPFNGLETGIMFGGAFIVNANQVRVRLQNTTGASKITSRDWKFDIIKQ